jgi:hypothetical protein
MTRIVLKSQVGRDGILHLDLPVGIADANKEVQITVDPVRPSMSQEEWRKFIAQTAGSISDPEFRRWDEGGFEDREPL